MSSNITIVDTLVTWYKTHPETYSNCFEVSADTMNRVLQILRDDNWYVSVNSDGEYAVSHSKEFGEDAPTLHEFYASPSVSIQGKLYISPDKKSVDDVWNRIRDAQASAINGALDKELASRIFIEKMGLDFTELSIYAEGSKDIEIDEL